MKIWVHIDGRQLGPYTIEQLPLMEMDATTPVWYDGLSHWTPAGQAPATASLFAPTSPETILREEASATNEDLEAEMHENEAEIQERVQDDVAPSTTPTPGSWTSSSSTISYRSDEPLPECPPTYLIWSILLTLCCCNPLGLIPIITGARVSSKYNNMDFEGAKRASVTTEWWVIICFVVGLMMIPFNIIMFL